MMTGWIKLTRTYSGEPIYFCVDHIVSVYARKDEGTHIDTTSGEYDVLEDAKQVLGAIRLSRPVRT